MDTSNTMEKTAETGAEKTTTVTLSQQKPFVKPRAHIRARRVPAKSVMKTTNDSSVPCKKIYNLNDTISSEELRKFQEIHGVNLPKPRGNAVEIRELESLRTKAAYIHNIAEHLLLAGKLKDQDASFSIALNEIPTLRSAEADTNLLEQESLHQLRLLHSDDLKELSGAMVPIDDPEEELSGGGVRRKTCPRSTWPYLLSRFISTAGTQDLSDYLLENFAEFIVPENK